MKTIIKITIIVLWTLAFTSNTNAQAPATKLKTENIKVSGMCESCKSRIEKAAKLDGVSKATWNKDTKILTLIFDPSKVSSDDIQKKIAAAGHDTEKYKANDKAYNALPGCCKYK
jgi:periplasmic mercuric ion binding protein